MRPICEPILNSIKIKDGIVRSKIAKIEHKNLAKFLKRQEVWFSLVQLLISAAQGLDMEDQTIQQALMLMKTLSLERKSELETSMYDELCQGLVCLMVASKIQDSSMHLKVENVVQLLRKFLDDNRSLSHPSFPSLSRPNAGFDEQFGSRRLQNRALLEQVAGLEKATIKNLKFHLNVVTPAEFIVVYL